MQTWVIAIYLLATNLKGTSSMKLHRDLGITQKTAWHLAHRLRETWAKNTPPAVFAGPVEVDETYLGGKRKNMPKSKRCRLKGRGSVGKTTVIGVKERNSNTIEAMSVKSADGPTAKKFIGTRVDKDAQVYTDESKAYAGIPFDHETVNHSAGEYVRDMAHTNGIESFWSMLKRGYHGTYHHMSQKHVDRYVREFSGRHNIRSSDTLNQMASVVRGMDKKTLRYSDLIED